MPDPLSISELAREMLKVPDQPVKYGSFSCYRVSSPPNESSQSSPVDIVASRRKLVCDVCTNDPARPIMIMRGSQWEAHIYSKAHCHLARRDIANAANPHTGLLVG